MYVYVCEYVSTCLTAGCTPDWEQMGTVGSVQVWVSGQEGKGRRRRSECSSLGDVWDYHSPTKTPLQMKCFVLIGGAEKIDNELLFK